MTTTNEKPIKTISAQAARALRISLMSWANCIDRHHSGQGRAILLRDLRHLCDELGVDQNDIVIGEEAN